MANKRPKPEEIVTRLRQVEVLTGQGMPRLDAIRQIGVTEQTFYRWKKKYGGMGTDQLKELKRLQKENERLRKAVQDWIKAVGAKTAYIEPGSPSRDIAMRCPAGQCVGERVLRKLQCQVPRRVPEWRNLLQLA